MSLLPEVREMTLLADGNWFHKFLSNAGFYLTARNPPVVQFEPISEYMDCLLEFGELEFPLDLTSNLGAGN